MVRAETEFDTRNVYDDLQVDDDGRVRIGGEFAGDTVSVIVVERGGYEPGYGHISVREFAADRLEATVDAVVPKDEVYTAYEAYCDAVLGTDPIPKNTFSQELLALPHLSVEATRRHVDGELTYCYLGMQVVGDE